MAMYLVIYGICIYIIIGGVISTRLNRKFTQHKKPLRNEEAVIVILFWPLFL